MAHALWTVRKRGPNLITNQMIMRERWKNEKIEMNFKTEGASSDGLIKNQ